MKPGYELLTAETVPAYVASQPHLAKKVDASSFQAQEVGDGNLNLVFVGRDDAGAGLCLKQSLPYVRLVGEAWPLTPERVMAETRGYEAALAASPADIPEFYGLDEDRYIIAMENLDALVIWRSALNEGLVHRGVAAQLGRFVARTAFTTSVFSLDPQALKKKVAEAINPELCQITEDLVFSEPYGEHPNNSFYPAVAATVSELRSNAELVGNVGQLKTKFMTSAEALIHGDLHSGSVMVPSSGSDSGEPVGRVIDPEFCFYGPVGFDLGALFGNYLAAQARSVVIERDQEFRIWVAGLVAETWQAFEAEMRALWPTRSERFLSDDFLEFWLRGVLADAVGFGGCKAVRRIIGLAKVSDIETLEGIAHSEAAKAVLRIGGRWITERRSLLLPAQIEAVAAQELARITLL